MKKIKIAIQFALFIIILLLCNKVSAASVTLAPNKSTVTTGEEFTISMNLSGTNLATLDVRITVDTSKVEYVSSTVPDNTNFSNGKIIYTWTDTSGGSNPKGEGTIVTFRLKAKSAGTANFSLTGNFYDANENSVVLNLNGTNVTIVEATPVEPPTTPEEPSNPEEPTTQEQPENNNPTQEENNNEPTTSEENNQPSEEPNQNNNQENTNNNTQLSSNAYLKSLQISVEGISPNFNRNTTKYYLIINNTIDSIKVNAIPEDSNAKVDINGNTNLQNGTNVITITVTAQNGTTKRVYLIDVTKTDDPNNANTNLENLAIENVTLNSEFQADVLEYSATVGSNIENLKILAVPEIEGASVNITGANNLSFGNNIITVTVTAKNGASIKNYTINIYRRTEAEDIEEEQRKLQEAQNEINQNNEAENTTNDILNNNTKNNYALWILFIILIIILIVIIVYLIIKKKRKIN